MARVLLVALTWCAISVRAEEYSGGSMPQYAEYDTRAGAAALHDDYRGHSHDASAPLDYKYEEEQHVNTDKKYIDDSDPWQKPTRKQNRPMRTIDRDELELDNETQADLVPKFKLTRRSSRRRPRLKEKSRRNEDSPRIRPVSYGRSKHDSRMSDYDDKADYIEDEKGIASRETTARVIKRKPRDRMYVPPPPTTRAPEQDEDELVADRRLKDDNMMDLDYPNAAGGRRRRPVARDPFSLDERPSFVDRPRLGDSDDDDVSSEEKFRKKYKNYQEYSDYYDMKRVNNVKNKLPSLLRRTTTSAAMLPPSTTSDLLQALWSGRRAGALSSPRPNYSLADPPTHTIITTATPDIMTRSTAAPVPSIVPSSMTATRELSLAEKSRLSILKKAQLKESAKVEPPKKPPVLLQVTSKMPTVVMVEPPTSADPWMRAREVTADTPERLEKVKQLMRRKLVAGAKNIRDLTDDWDNMVCDYIDVSLLDSAPSRHLLSLPLIYIMLLWNVLVRIVL